MVNLKSSPQRYIEQNPPDTQRIELSQDCPSASKDLSRPQRLSIAKIDNESPQPTLSPISRSGRENVRIVTGVKLDLASVSITPEGIRGSRLKPLMQRGPPSKEVFLGIHGRNAYPAPPQLHNYRQTRMVNVEDHIGPIPESGFSGVHTDFERQLAEAAMIHERNYLATLIEKGGLKTATDIDQPTNRWNTTTGGESEDPTLTRLTP